MAKTTKALHREYDNEGNVTHKECRGCNKILPIDLFYVKGKKSQTNKDGREHRCIECHKAKWRIQAEDDTARVRWLLERIRSKCKKLSIPFNLVVSDIVIPEVCPVLGRPLKFGVSRTQSYERRGMAPPTDDSPSVDRIDSTKGYTKDNIIVVSWRANRIKGNATPEELVMLADFYTNLAKSKGA